VTPVSLRLGAPRSRGHPPDPLLGLHCTQTGAGLARLPTPVSAQGGNQQSSNSATMDWDVAREDDLSTQSNTKSRTHANEVHRASSSASTSRRAACSTSSRPAASSSRSASRARLDGGPRSRSQTLAPDHSRRELRSSCFWNSATNLSTTST
jgi:hypothetical protein